MVSETCIVDSLKMYKLYEKVIKFIRSAMKNWKVELTAAGKTLVEEKIQQAFSNEMHFHPHYLL